MTFRYAVLVLWCSVASACAGDAATGFEGALDGAVLDGDAGGPALPQHMLAPATTTATAASVAAAAAALDVASAAADEAAVWASESESESEGDLAAEAGILAAHEHGETLGADGEHDAYSGVALASSIGGIRALLGTAYGEHGPMRVLEQENMVLALASAHEPALDARSRAWRGRRVRVLTSANQQCSGRVASFELASQWIWKDELFAPEAKPSETEVRNALSGALGSVVARVALDRPDSCRGRPLLIQEAAQAAPRVARTLRHVPRQREILAAFRSLPRYRALQTECLQPGDCSQDEAGTPIVRDIELKAFEFPRDRAVYVVASLALGGCGDWAPPMSAIFKLAPGRAPTLHRVNDETALGAPVLLLDVARDGKLELVTTRYAGELELVDEQGASRRAWSTHFIGCSC